MTNLYNYDTTINKYQSKIDDCMKKIDENKENRYILQKLIKINVNGIIQLTKLKRKNYLSK